MSYSLYNETLNVMHEFNYGCSPLCMLIYINDWKIMVYIHKIGNKNVTVG